MINCPRAGLSICSFVVFAMTMFPPWTHAVELPYSVGLGFEFASGTYGTGVRTQSVFVPLTAAFYPNERTNFSLEIPFVYQSNGNVNTGLFSGAQERKTLMLPANGMGGMGGSMNGPRASGMGALSGDAGHSQYGLGDITLKAGYVLIVEDVLTPQVRPNLLVKFPSADSDKALGTGEFDAGFAVELSKWLDRWNTFAEAGYVVQGKTAKLPLRNYLAYNAGLAYQLSESFRPMLYVKGATPPADDTGSLLELRMKLKYQPTRHTGIEAYLAKGITRNSPEYGSGFAVFYDF